MKNRKFVRVLQGPNGRAERIFRNKDWLNFPVELVYKATWAEAVKDIREQVFDRAWNRARGWETSHVCQRCGRSITWETMEMHETLPKGKGGEVSLANCEALCHNCHTAGPDAAHADRRWQTSKISPEGQNGN